MTLDRGELTPEQRQAGAEFARSQHRVPYRWTGVGEDYDTIGFQSAVLDAALEDGRLTQTGWLDKEQHEKLPTIDGSWRKALGLDNDDDDEAVQ